MWRYNGLQRIINIPNQSTIKPEQSRGFIPSCAQLRHISAGFSGHSLYSRVVSTLQLVGNVILTEQNDLNKC